MEQYWEIWNPKCGFLLAQKYHINSLVDNPDGMYIFLSAVDDKSHITIQFPGRVISYRTKVSLASLKSRMDFLDESQHPIKEDASFFVVRNSEYSKNIEWDSQGIFQAKNLIHFVLDAQGEIFEVITELYPKFVEGWLFETEEQKWGPFGDITPQSV